MGVTFKMFVTHFLLVCMLVISSQASHMPERERALQEEDRFSPQFVLDLIIGALIPDKPTTTTTTSTVGPSTTPGAPGPVIGAIGGIIGLPGAIIGGLLPGEAETTTTTTTTTTTPTTTRCGGLIGGGLLGC